MMTPKYPQTLKWRKYDDNKITYVILFSIKLSYNNG